MAGFRGGTKKRYTLSIKSGGYKTEVKEVTEERKSNR